VEAQFPHFPIPRIPLIIHLYPQLDDGKSGLVCYPSSKDSAMTNSRDFDHPTIYQIRLKGTLDDESASYWFLGFTVSPQPDGETLIEGPVMDEAALHGLLARIRDLGLNLLSLERMEK
jgi:hypothetical protein